MGDVYSAMGDGEVWGTGIECGAYVTIRFELIKNYAIPRPRVETENEIMCVASGDGLEAAIKIALQDMVTWLHAERQLSLEEAYVLVSLAGDVRIGQIGNPAVTVRVVIPKNIFVG